MPREGAAAVTVRAKQDPISPRTRAVLVRCREAVRVARCARGASKVVSPVESASTAVDAESVTIAVAPVPIAIDCLDLRVHSPAT